MQLDKYCMKERIYNALSFKGEEKAHKFMNFAESRGKKQLRWTAVLSVVFIRFICEPYC